MKETFTATNTGHSCKLRHLLLLVCVLTVSVATPARGGGNSASALGNTATGSDEAQTTPQSATRNISGQIFDAQGVPLIGATVMIKGTSKGIHTDTNGKFTLSIPNTGKVVILAVSYVGMKSREVGVTTQNTLTITLEPDTEIGEVVVTGYGVVQRREDLVGSAYQISSKKLELMPVRRVDNMLDGMVPGLQVTQGINGNEEAFRTRLRVRVRGDASLDASSEPLWIIDGAPVYTGDRNGQVTGTLYTVSPLSFINPTDIESITVLKDASTAALYGADGANGVILITTKQGKSEETRVNIGIKYGVSFPNESTRFKVLNASQYMAYAKEAWTNAGNPISAFPYQDSEYNSYSTTDTRWNEVYLGAGQNLQVDLSASGGTKRMKNYLSAGFYTDDMMLKGNNQRRLSLRSNSTYTLVKGLEATVIMGGSYNVNNIFSLTRSYYETLPIFSPYENDGHTMRLYNYYSNESLTEYKPSMLKFTQNKVPEREENDNRQRTLNASLNALLKWEPIEGLSGTVQFATNYMGVYEDIYNARTNLSGYIEGEPMGKSERRGTYNLNWNNVDRINFNRTFGRHRVGAMAGIEFKHEENRYLNLNGYGFINDQIKEMAYVSADKIKGSSNTAYSRSLSYIGQVSYSYDNRYFIAGTLRRQGFSSFGEYSRWGNFASIGLSWNVHNEAFFKSKIFDTLKVKFSYGSTGNSRVDTSAAHGTYSISTSSGYIGNMGAVQSSAPNPGLTWETTLKTNLGVSVGICKRVLVDIEYYNEVTKDMLASSRISMIVTEDSIMRNLGEMRNRGVEININSTNIRSRDFTWTSELNLAHNSNKILKLYQRTTISKGEYVWEEGQPKNAWCLIRWAGIDPADGQPMWYDKRGNITKTYNYENRVTTGKVAVPSVFGSLTNTLQWKQLTLRFMLNYSIGGWHYTVMDRMSMNAASDIISTNTSVNALEYWKKPGELAINPRIAYKNQMRASSYTDRFLHRMTNIRLQNVALTYQFPQQLCKKLRMAAASVSLVGDNVYLWTPDQKRGKNSYKTTMNAGFPMLTSYSIDLSVTF